MANIKSVEKRARQSVKRRDRNSSILSGLRTEQRRARGAIAEGNVEQARTAIQSLSSALDKAAKRGVIHKNSADRRKSALGKKLAALG